MQLAGSGGDARHSSGIGRRVSRSSSTVAVTPLPSTLSSPSTATTDWDKKAARALPLDGTRLTPRAVAANITIVDRTPRRRLDNDTRARDGQSR